MKFTRETLLIGFISAALMSFAACGGGTSSNNNGNGGGNNPPAAISVALSSPPASVTAGQTAQFTATVANDSANAGVTWSCTPANNCGSFSPTKTASGAATTYTAPGTAGSVTVIATSVTDGTKTATAMVTVAAAQQGGLSINVSGPTSVAPSATGTFTATVTNDSAGKGVTWSCTPANSCGSFNPQSGTGNTVTTTYTAPATAPSGGSVTIVATANADGKTTGSATVSIAATQSLNLGAGTYVYYAVGEDAGGHTYGVEGAVQLDGSGNVTGGEQDYDNAAGINSNEPSTPDQISATGGKLTLGSNGNGTLTIQTNNTAEGKSGLETFAITVVNGKHALISQFDSTATSSGSLDLQTPGITQAQQAGTYAFEVTGYSSTHSYSQGGVITINGAGTWSNMVTDFNEMNGKVTINQQTTVTEQNGVTTSNNIQDQGSGPGFSTPDQFNRVTSYFGGIYFTSYAVTPKFQRILGYYPQTGTVDALYIGSMVSQGTSSGASTAAALKGTFAFTDSSVHTVGDNNQTYGAAGMLTFDGNGNVTGFMDANQTATASFAPAVKSGAVTGTYTIAPTVLNVPPSSTTTVTGTALVTITAPGGTISKLGLYLTDPTINLLDPNSTSNSASTTPEAFLVDLDGSTSGPNFVGAGVLIPQTATTAGTGTFAVTAQAFNAKGQVNAVGPISIATGGVITGNIAVNDLFNTGTQNPSVAFGGTLTADTTNAGRFTLSVTGTSQTYVLYEIDAGDYVLVETDTSQTGVGLSQLQ